MHTGSPIIIIIHVWCSEQLGLVRVSHAVTQEQHAVWQADPAGVRTGCITGAAGFYLDLCQPAGLADCSYTVVTLVGPSEAVAAGPD